MLHILNYNTRDIKINITKVYERIVDFHRRVVSLLWKKGLNLMAHIYNYLKKSNFSQ